MSKWSKSFGVPRTLPKKANINSFLKLTITSQLKPAEKVTKIFQIFNERNGKLVEYLTDILLKNLIAAVNTLASVAMSIKDITPDCLAHALRELVDHTEEFAVLAAKTPDTLVNLKRCIGLSRQLEHLRDSILK